MKIKDIMTTECRWISPGAKVAEAAEIMRDEDIGFLPVGDEKQQKLIGTLTDRDIAVRCVAQGFGPAAHTVGDIMTGELLYCYEDEDVEQVCRNMAETRVRRFPVMDRGKRLVGVVSFGDLAQAAKDSEIARTQQDLTRECAGKERKAA